MSISSVVSQFSLTPRYTDADNLWVTQDTDLSYSVYFNPSKHATLENIAQAVEKFAVDLVELNNQNPHVAKVKLTIQIQRMDIRGHAYARQYLPNYKAAEVLRDREACNCVVWQKGSVGIASGCRTS